MHKWEEHTFVGVCVVYVYFSSVSPSAERKSEEKNSNDKMNRVYLGPWHRHYRDRQDKMRWQLTSALGMG